MTLFTRKGVLAAKIETTVGTDATPSATDAAMNIFNAKMELEVDVEDREGQGGFDMLAAVTGGRRARITFRTNLEWDGTATEPLWAETFFPACGWVKSSQTYTPRSEAPGSNVKTLTFSHYIDGKLRKAVGCMGTFKVTLPSGKMGYIEWDFLGSWVSEIDSALITPTYPTDTSYKFASGVCQWNDVNLYTSTVTIDAGNTVVLREDPSAASGYIAAIVTNRYPKVTLDPEAKTVATQDRIGAMLGNTQYALELHCGGVGNSKLQFDAPKAQITKVGYGDRDRRVIDQLEMACGKNGSTHDQCLSITFTAAT